jgi:hypothetical protein
MAAPNEATKPVGWDHDRDLDGNPELSDKSDQDPKLKDFDVEGQGRRGSQHHVTALDSDSTESIGRQIEMESENTIKYRTCSWQKVRGCDKEGVLELTDHSFADCCTSFL